MVGDTKWNMALLFEQQDLPAEALALMTGAYIIYAVAYGVEHDDSRAALENMQRFTRRQISIWARQPRSCAMSWFRSRP